MATGAPTIQDPPKLKGNSETDFWAYIQWLQNLYKSLILEGGIGQTSGSFTVSGTASFFDVAFPATQAPQADTNYQVVCSAVGSTGAPGDTAFVVAGVSNKTTAGCRISFRGSPGGGNSVTFNYVVSRPF